MLTYLLQFPLNAKSLRLTSCAVCPATFSGRPRAAAATRPGQSTTSRLGAVGDVSSTTSSFLVHRPSEGASDMLGNGWKWLKAEKWKILRDLGHFLEKNIRVIFFCDLRDEAIISVVDVSLPWPIIPNNVPWHRCMLFVSSLVGCPINLVDTQNMHLTSWKLYTNQLSMNYWLETTSALHFFGMEQCEIVAHGYTIHRVVSSKPKNYSCIFPISLGDVGLCSVFPPKHWGGPGLALIQLIQFIFSSFFKPLRQVLQRWRGWNSQSGFQGSGSARRTFIPVKPYPAPASLPRGQWRSADIFCVEVLEFQIISSHCFCVKASDIVWYNMNSSTGSMFTSPPKCQHLKTWDALKLSRPLPFFPRRFALSRLLLPQGF